MSHFGFYTTLTKGGHPSINQAEKQISGINAADTRKKTSLSPLIEFFIRILATVLAIWLLLTFVTGIFVCHTDTCSPMVKDGDLCVTWKIGTHTSGDLMIYHRNGRTKFGRVVAIAGDKVEIKDNVVWVNGYVAVQEPLANPFGGTPAVRFPYTVPEQSVFVLCDNTASVDDSRTYGAVSLADSQGKVIFLMRRRGI